MKNNYKLIIGFWVCFLSTGLEAAVQTTAVAVGDLRKALKDCPVNFEELLIKLLQSSAYDDPRGRLGEAKRAAMLEAVHRCYGAIAQGLVPESSVDRLKDLMSQLLQRIGWASVPPSYDVALANAKEAAGAVTIGQSDELDLRSADWVEIPLAVTANMPWRYVSCSEFEKRAMVKNLRLFTDFQLAEVGFLEQYKYSPTVEKGDWIYNSRASCAPMFQWDGEKWIRLRGIVGTYLPHPPGKESSQISFVKYSDYFFDAIIIVDSYEDLCNNNNGSCSYRHIELVVIADSDGNFDPNKVYAVIRWPRNPGEPEGATGPIGLELVPGIRRNELGRAEFK